jgi:spermidine synthase
MRILKRHAGGGLKTLVSQVLTFDYLGALAVSIAFPLLFVPQLGLIRTGAFFGLLNAGVAIWALWLFRAEVRRVGAQALACVLTVAALAAAFVFADRVTTWAEDRFYADHVLYSETSAYQRIVVTSGHAGVRLFLNGNLQFHSRDEYRYHEALVHPALAAAGQPRRVLVVGGGDGMAIREILKYPSVEKVTLVELDPHMTELFSTMPLLRGLTATRCARRGSTVVNADAFAWLEQHDEMFDAIVVDFPDPTNFSIGKLYTKTFYELVDRHLSASGYAVVQTTSPLIAARASGPSSRRSRRRPRRDAVPRARAELRRMGLRHRVAAPVPRPRRCPAGCASSTATGSRRCFEFPPDMARVPAEVNRLSNQVLVQTFEDEWGQVQR